nr:unnamed protein product [Callosobruchus analis]
MEISKCLFPLRSDRLPQPNQVLNVNRFTIEEIRQAADRMKNKMHNQILSRTAKTANDLRRILTTACNASMPRKTKKRNRGPVYRWTQEIACLRRDCLRAYTKRNIPNHVREIHGLSYKQAKRELRQAIKASKLSCWRKLIAEVDEDIWGKGYRIVFATLRMGSPLPEMSLEKKKTKQE